jgi:hypothetical protein
MLVLLKIQIGYRKETGLPEGCWGRLPSSLPFREKNLTEPGVGKEFLKVLTHGGTGSLNFGWAANVAIPMMEWKSLSNNCLYFLDYTDIILPLSRLNILLAW